jgi:hypothetical protein
MSENTEKQKKTASRFFLVFYDAIKDEDNVSKGSCVVGTDGTFVNQMVTVSTICRDLKLEAAIITNVIPVTEEEAMQWSARPTPTMKSDAVVN